MRLARRWTMAIPAVAAVAATVAAAGIGSGETDRIDPAIHKIQHVIIIMQENRSFDSYFGTYPGADGIPMRHGVPTVCMPDPRVHHCVRPYHNRNDLNYGGPHQPKNARLDIHRGRMNGFIRQEQRGV